MFWRAPHLRWNHRQRRHEEIIRRESGIPIICVHTHNKGRAFTIIAVNCFFLSLILVNAGFAAFINLHLLNELFMILFTYRSWKRRADGPMGIPAVVNLDQLHKRSIAPIVRRARVGFQLGIQQRAPVNLPPAPRLPSLGSQRGIDAPDRRVSLFRTRVCLGTRATRRKPVLVQLIGICMFGRI